MKNNPPVQPIQFEEHRLANGLQLILHRDARTPLIHVSLHYRVGSSYERPGLSGFAHLFEHMMFQGSASVGKNEHGRYIDQAGGRWNASTNKDRTNYYQTVPSNYLELCLWLEADRMRSLAVNTENFENQRQTVIEEKKQSYDNRPYGLAELRLDELAYHNWAYAHPVIGAVEDLRNASLNDAQEFHLRHYGPGKATLAISGDFVPDEAVGFVKQHFADIPDRTDNEVQVLDETPQTEGKLEIVADPLAPLPAVLMGYHVDGMGTPSYYALSILAIILAGGDSARLTRKLVYEQNAVTGVFSALNQYKGPGLFRVSFQGQKSADLDTVRNIVLEEIERVCTFGVTEQEMEKARNQITHRFIARLTTVSGVGEALCRYAVYFDAPNLINDQLGHFLAVTGDDLKSAAHFWLRPHNLTQVIVKPGELR